MGRISFATFRLGKQKYGIDISKVREINRSLDLTPVPDALNHVCGLINLRGQIITVFDLNIRFGLPKSDITEKSHNIILKPYRFNSSDDSHEGGDTVGLIVDSIEDVAEVDDSEIEAPPANIGKVDGTFLTGVMKTDNDLVALLNVGEILKQE